jgi:hypothetical protein
MRGLIGGWRKVVMSMRVSSWGRAGKLTLLSSVFVLEIDPSTKSLAVLDLPLILVSFIRIILFDSEWDRSKTKGKPPKPRIDLVTLNVMKKVLGTRLESYPTTLEVGSQQFLDSSAHLITYNRKTR